MKNRFELEFKTSNAEVGCEVMDWLNENRVEYSIGGVNLGKKKKTFVFSILANRLNVAEVSRFIEEV